MPLLVDMPLAMLTPFPVLTPLLDEMPLNVVTPLSVVIPLKDVTPKSVDDPTSSACPAHPAAPTSAPIAIPIRTFLAVSRIVVSRLPLNDQSSNQANITSVNR